MNLDLAKPYQLPTTFTENLIFVEPVGVDGSSFQFYTDTGGALWLQAAEASRLDLIQESASVDEWPTCRLPEFRDDAWIPLPTADRSIMINPEPVPDYLVLGRSGMLGQQWFAGRIWEIDYAAQRMIVHPSLPIGSSGQTVPLGFPEAAGQRVTNFPRVQAVVDSETLDLLLDTGAQTQLTASASASLALPSGPRATSFITDSVARRWQENHPDWPVVRDAEQGTGFAIIRVPNVQVADLDTGPVWFTFRHDPSFLEYMSQWTDKAIVGALGGNALSAFRVILDYPGARASFEPTLRK